MLLILIKIVELGTQIVEFKLLQNPCDTKFYAMNFNMRSLILD
jgi:hypothetical protein